MLLDTLELVRVLSALVETFTFELPVPRLVVTCVERFTVVLLLVAFSLVVAERVFTFVPDVFARVEVPSLVTVERLSVPSLSEVLRLTSLPLLLLLLLLIVELLLSTEEAVRCEDVGRVPDDLTPLA